MGRLDLQRTSIGSWCQIGHPANAEILARSGFAWLAADCEHGEFTDGDIGHFCRAVRLSPCVPLVRVAENAVMPIRRALDLGADGVVVPLVNSADEARRAVQAAHYPPRGIRGFAWQRGNGWGADFTDYAAGFAPLVVVMIESRSAVEEIDAIMAVDGVDACFIGPYDLSGSLGIPGQVRHPLVTEACVEVAAACRRHGKAAGRHLVTPARDEVAESLSQGFTFLALGMDSAFLGGAARSALAMVP